MPKIAAVFRAGEKAPAGQLSVPPKHALNLRAVDEGAKAMMGLGFLRLKVGLLCLCCWWLSASPGEWNAPVAAAEGAAASAGGLTAELQQQEMSAVASICLERGDAKRGEEIFQRSKLGCVKCHVATLEAGKDGQRTIGPDHSTVGDRLKPEEIVESILYPSRVIAKGYEAVVILTQAGKVARGVVVSEHPDAVVLIDSDTGNRLTIARADIEEMEPTVSAMPAGLADQLSGPQEFYDLIAYLSSRRASDLGAPVMATDHVIVQEVPQPSAALPLVAVAQPNGICFSYDPNQFRLEAVWEGPLGWLDAAGQFTLNQAAGIPFHIRNQPWKIDVGRIRFDFEWLGYEVVNQQVQFRYRLTDKERGRHWTVTESVDAPSLLQQTLEFQISHPAESREVLTYWLEQTHYRSVKTNGQQAQRNQLEFLKPGQAAFTLRLARRPTGRTIPAGYSVARVAGPVVEKPYLFEPTAFSFAPDGTLFVSTRTGGIWRWQGDEWNLFADGLHETLGVRVAQNGRDVYTMQKPECTLLEDADSDGVAEVYRSVADSFRFTGSYHEFAYGPVMNAAGELFFSTGLAASGHHEAKESKTGQMSSPLGYRGWVMKVDATGQLTPFACGLRSPAGIGMNAADELFVTDNQGDWVASSYLGHVEEGDFLGHPAALWDRPEYGLTPAELDHRTVGVTVAKVPPLDEEQYRAQRKPPAVWLVHGDLTNSPGNPSFAPEVGFGPFGGQAFIADISHRAIVRVALEKVNGVYQGAVFPFIRPLASASYSTCFDPDGRLWVGSVGRGWTTGNPMIEVISYDGQTNPFEMHRIRLTRTGFAVDFTAPVDQAALDEVAISIKRFHYLYWAEYGSDRQDVRQLLVNKPQLTSDGLTLHLPVAVDQGHVYEIDLGLLQTIDGTPLQNNFAFYTVNEVRQ
jgi:putative heme-binding domain-containing protein